VDKSEDMKNRFYEELKRVLDQFKNYHMKVLSVYFDERVRRRFLYQSIAICKEKWFIVVNFATSINITGKSTVFPNLRIHK